jgi:succinate dehydrogenase / fumarate reductase membrane anchor subunit
MHFSGPENLTYEAVMVRFQNPFWIVFNILFLSSACYHGFNGLWGITLEYVRSEKWVVFVRYSYTMAGVALVAVGLYILTLG